MIFVTVGTHEQQFNRLIEEIDRLKGNGTIKDEVIMQTGYCTYKPKYCKWSELLPYDQMLENVEKADIVITHGGPSSFIMPLQIGKVPIVVPRQETFHEHVNNHQVDFAEQIEKRMGTIIPIYNIEDLKDTIINYDSIVASMNSSMGSNNKQFNKKLGKIVDGLFK